MPDWTLTALTLSAGYAVALTGWMWWLRDELEATNGAH